MAILEIRADGDDAPPAPPVAVVALISPFTFAAVCRVAVVSEAATARVPTLPDADLTADAVEPIGSAAYAADVINTVVFTIFVKVASMRNVIVMVLSMGFVENVGTIVIFDGACPLVDVIAAKTAAATSLCIAGVIMDALPLLAGKRNESVCVIREETNSEKLIGTEFREGVERGEIVEDMVVVVVAVVTPTVTVFTAYVDDVTEGEDPFDRDAVGVAVEVGVPDDEEVRLAVGVEAPVPLSEPVTEGLEPTVRDAVGVRVGEDERLDVVLGVTEEVGVPLLVDVTVDVTDKLEEGVINPVPESELVELGLAPFVIDAVGVRVDDAARLVVVLDVCEDVGVPVIVVVAVPVPLTVGGILMVEVVDDIIEFELLSDPVELELAPKVRDDVGVCDEDDERLSVDEGVPVEATTADCVDVDVSLPPGRICEVGVVVGVSLPTVHVDGVKVGVTLPTVHVDGVDIGVTLAIDPKDGVDIGVTLATGIDPKDGVGVCVERGGDPGVHAMTHAWEPEMTCDLDDAMLPSLQALSAPSTFNAHAPPLNEKPGAHRTRKPRE